jgi:hypothetical protein
MSASALSVCSKVIEILPRLFVFSVSAQNTEEERHVLGSLLAKLTQYRNVDFFSHIPVSGKLQSLVSRGLCMSLLSPSPQKPTQSRQFLFSVPAQDIEDMMDA